VDDPAGFSLADILLGLGSSAPAETSPTPTGPRCPNCGFTQADFKKGGRFGCAECYRTFRDGLESMLKTMHKGIRHTGKVPRHLQRAADVSDQLKQLQKRLEKAVESEDFEQAALLRDEIRQLRAQEQQPAPGTTDPTP
jgi:protein arginine kinase activator